MHIGVAHKVEALQIGVGTGVGERVADDGTPVGEALEGEGGGTGATVDVASHTLEGGEVVTTNQLSLF